MFCLRGKALYRKLWNQFNVHACSFVPMTTFWQMLIYFDKEKWEYETYQMACYSLYISDGTCLMIITILVYSDHSTELHV